VVNKIGAKQDELMTKNTKVLMVDNILSTKSTRLLLNEITTCGTTFYDILVMEPKLKVLTNQFSYNIISMFFIDQLQSNIITSILIK